MERTCISSVIIEGGAMRCITASVTAKSGEPGIAMRGVTDAAARDILRLVIAAAEKRGFRLPRKAITVELVFDVPFERTSELSFTTLLALAATL